MITPSIEDPDNYMGFISMTYDSPTDEDIYGLGLQPTIWNFKGQKAMIVCTEGGIGRGLEPLTSLVNMFTSGGGGSEHTTYSASYGHITSYHRVFSINSTALGEYHFNDN